MKNRLKKNLVSEFLIKILFFWKIFFVSLITLVKPSSVKKNNTCIVLPFPFPFLLPLKKKQNHKQGKENRCVEQILN